MAASALLLLAGTIDASSTSIGLTLPNEFAPALPFSKPPPAAAAVVPGNPLDDVKLLVDTVGSLLRGNALRQGAKAVSFASASRERVGA